MKRREFENKLLSNYRLEGIWKKECLLKTEPDILSALNQKTKVNIENVLLNIIDEGDKYVFEYSGRVFIGEKGEEKLIIHCIYNVVYVQNEKEKMEKTEMEENAKYLESHCKYLVWPYFRKDVYSFTVEANLPPLTLPVLQVSFSEEKE